MQVQIISKKLIKPSVPTPNHLRNLKLSCMDQLAPAAYGSFIFYFSANANMTTSEEFEILNQLETSLSETLTVFYPLAGRYMKDTNSIDCNDQGAEYFRAQVQGQLDQFLQEKSHDSQLNRFIPIVNEVVAFSPTVLKIQVNMFDCGGLAIGICLSHKAADGFVIFSFAHGWAAACKNRIHEMVSLSFDMGSVCPSKDAEWFEIPVPEDGGAKMITKRFVFYEYTISSLKASAKPQGSGLILKRNPSRVEVVTALIWKARINAVQAKHGHLRPSLLTLAYNFRGKTALELPKNFFGNGFKLVLARFRPNETKLEIPDLVKLIGNAISNTAADCSRTENVDDLFLSANNSMREIHELLKNKDTDIFVFTSVCRFPYYEIDFGWGKPSWVSSVHKPSDIVLMMDTKCGTGIEAWVTLDEEEMLEFQQDQDILAYTTQCLSQLAKLL